jgi:hypothetical protein
LHHGVAWFTRHVTKHNIGALRSVLTGDLSAGEEYVLKNSEEIIYFSRVFQGALRRCKEQAFEAEVILCSGTVASVLPCIFELLHISQFQHERVAARLAEAALSMAEDLSKCCAYKEIQTQLHDALTW